jgi:hypothetical protein
MNEAMTMAKMTTASSVINPIIIARFLFPVRLQKKRLNRQSWRKFRRGYAAPA